MSRDRAEFPTAPGAEPTGRTDPSALASPPPGVVDRFATVGSRRTGWIGRYGLVLLGLACVGAIWAGVLYEIREDRRAAAQEAAQATTNLVRAFEEHIIRSIRGADQTLLFVREIYARDPAAFDVRPWANASEAANGFTFQVSILDAAGRFVTSNLDPTGRNRIDLRA